MKLAFYSSTMFRYVKYLRLIGVASKVVATSPYIEG